MNLVTLKAAAKLELLLNKPTSGHRRLEAGLLHKSSCLAPALGAAKFTNSRDMT
jgi:hypothetical protein